MYSNPQKGGPQTLTLGLNLNSGLTPFPAQGPKAILAPPLFKQACLGLMAFSSNLLTYSDLPMSPKFPWLSEVLYWDFEKIPVSTLPLSKGQKEKNHLELHQQHEGKVGVKGKKYPRLASLGADSCEVSRKCPVLADAQQTEFLLSSLLGKNKGLWDWFTSP